MGILSPTRGDRITHRNLKFGYFSQHHVDQLDMNLCSVELLQQAYSGLLPPCYFSFFSFCSTNLCISGYMQESPWRSIDVSWGVLVSQGILPSKVLQVYQEVKNREWHLLSCAWEIQTSLFWTNLPTILTLNLFMP